MKMTEQRISELKAKAFDIIMRANAVYLDEDGDVRIGYPLASGTREWDISDKEDIFLSLVMSEDYELAEKELE